MHDGITTRRIYRLWQPWKKLHEKVRGGNRKRGTNSRVHVETLGADERGVIDSGMDTGDA